MLTSIYKLFFITIKHFNYINVYKKIYARMFFGLQRNICSYKMVFNKHRQRYVI